MAGGGGFWQPLPGGGAGAAFMGALVSRTSNQSIAGSSETLLSWDAESYDTDSIHDNVTNSSRLTVPVDGDGVWMVGASLRFLALAADNLIYSVIYKNGAAFTPYVWAQGDSAMGNNPTIALSAPVALAAGDYIEVYGYHSYGGARDVDFGFSSFWMYRIGT